MHCPVRRAVNALTVRMYPSQIGANVCSWNGSNHAKRFQANTQDASMTITPSQPHDGNRAAIVVRCPAVLSDEMILTKKGATQIMTETAIRKKAGQENGMECFCGGGGGNDK